MAEERIHGFIAVASPLFFSQRSSLAKLALHYRMAGMVDSKESVRAGGLMSYGADVDDLTRRAATYIDKILKGTKPAELPVEQATKFELAINLKTAKAVGIEIQARSLPAPTR